jgi:peroxiredoxin (alkyl hydroperoxide reductase subunit C)
MVQIGQTIPNLSAEAYQADQTVKLSLEQYRGKWLVLLFYPADFTFVCPTELREAAKYYPEFSSRNTEVLSVSVDTVFVHKAWHDQSDAIKGITFPMVADPKKIWCDTFGTLNADDGLSFRATFIIDPDGILKVMEIHDNSIGRSTKEILRKLKAAQFTREHGDQVCPASWEEGEQTLKPGMNLVGKI